MEHKDNIWIGVLYDNPEDMRYAVYDSETGELLDDAQGYGYKSEEKALRGWKYLKAKHIRTTKDRMDDAAKIALGNIVWRELGREVREEDQEVFTAFIREHKNDLVEELNAAFRGRIQKAIDRTFSQV